MSKFIGPYDLDPASEQKAAHYVSEIVRQLKSSSENRKRVNISVPRELQAWVEKALISVGCTRISFFSGRSDEGIELSNPFAAENQLKMLPAYVQPINELIKTASFDGHELSIKIDVPLNMRELIIDELKKAGWSSVSITSCRNSEDKITLRR